MAEILFSNNASTTLFTTIDAQATEITVSPGTGALFPTISPTKDEHFRVTLISTGGTFEIVKVVARVEDRFTIQRAQEGTQAKNFEQGSVVELRLTAGGLNWVAGRVGNIEDKLGFDSTGSSFNPTDDFVLAVINHPKFKHAAKHAKGGTDAVSTLSIGAANGDGSGNAINANQWGGSAIFRSSAAPNAGAGKVNDVWFQWI